MWLVCSKVQYSLISTLITAGSVFLRGNKNFSLYSLALVFFILASFFKELLIVGLKIDPEVLHLVFSPGRKRTSLPHNFSKKPWNLFLMSYYFRLCPSPYKSLEAEEKSTLIGQSESCAHHWSTLWIPTSDRRTGEGRFPRGKPKSSYQRKEKCFPDKQNNTCPP